jgi:tungstate transport system ATP-binding protein
MTMRAPATDLPIAFDDVTVLVGELPLLDRVSVLLTGGNTSVLVGPNGAGKTTLLRAAMGLLRPTRGRVTWGGRDDASPDRRAIMFQRPAMLRRTVEANIHYALAAANAPRATREERTRDLLATVGLKHLAHRPARKLSGGEQQRLALARALARTPTVLFLDEPTASLDPHATKSIEDVIGNIARTGVKVVMSTHDLNQAKRLAGDIVLLHRGCLIEHTPAAEFFGNPKTGEARRFIAGELLI